MYEYRAWISGASIKSTIDGDTVDLDFDLGFHVHLQKVRVRLLGINAPEIEGVEDKELGRKARQHLATLLVGKELRVQTELDRTEKYGRMLAIIYVEGSEDSVNAQMVRDGYALVYDGHGPR